LFLRLKRGEAFEEDFEYKRDEAIFRKNKRPDEKIHFALGINQIARFV